MEQQTADFVADDSERTFSGNSIEVHDESDRGRFAALGMIDVYEISEASGSSSFRCDCSFPSSHFSSLPAYFRGRMFAIRVTRSIRLNSNGTRSCRFYSETVAEGTSRSNYRLSGIRRAGVIDVNLVVDIRSRLLSEVKTAMKVCYTGLI